MISSLGEGHDLPSRLTLLMTAKRADSDKAPRDSGGISASPLSCICLCLPADHYSHVYSSKPTRFDSAPPADSPAACPDALRPLVELVSILWDFSSPCKCLQNVGY